jgi:hypothetical protein
MAFGVAETLGLISLLLGLTSSGIGIGKGAAASSEEAKIKRRNEEIAKGEKKNKQLAEKDARRKAIASAIGSRLNPFRTMPEQIDPYQPRDLSGYDVAAQSVGAGANLAGGLSQYAGANQNALDSVSAAGQSYEVGGYADPNKVYNTPAQPMPIETDTTGTNTNDLAKRPSRYGSYLTKRDEKYGTTSGQA